MELSTMSKKRISGLSQEYPIRKTTHQPEQYSFKPQIKKFIPESDRKKREIAKRYLKETRPHDKTAQLRQLISERLPSKAENLDTFNDHLLESYDKL